MPELPDVTVYLEALESRLLGQTLERALLKNPFLLRTADPPLHSCEGHRVVALRRVGKRIAIGFDNDRWLLIHLMIAGRLHWYDKSHTGAVRASLLSLQFTNGTLTLTEAGTKRRASLHVLSNAAQLADHDRGGSEVLGIEPAAFRERLSRTNHTLKRALTDPTILSGIGNAYSDEILHRARLSPTSQTRHLTDEEWQRLYEATQATLTDWIDRLRTDAAGAFPEKCTAATASPARSAAPPFREFATQKTKRTIARAARPAASCSPTVRCRGCSRTTGRRRSRRWRTSGSK
jgi:formamidopyrimidine-DNA glycosylase